MWSTKRANTKGVTMSGVDIFEMVFLVLVFLVGVIGFLKVATKDD